MDIMMQFKNLVNPSATLGAFLISMISGLIVSFICGYKIGINKKNAINAKVIKGNIYQDCNNEYKEK